METVIYRCKGIQVIQEGEIVGRKDCGKDLTELVQSIEPDGEIHKVKCSICGNIAQVLRVPE